MKDMKIIPIIAASVLVLFVGFASVKSLYGHCQVPCGIYDDQARFTLMAEHIATMEKAMTQVIELSKEKNSNFNQVVRWVTNKEKHAEALSDIITYYFMAQRIKPVPEANKVEYKAYRNKLELLHHLLVYTMKAKQSTDVGVIKKLRTLLHDFQHAYTGK